MSGAPALYLTAAAASGPTTNKITLDLSSATLVDANAMQGGSTSLGVSSTLGLAAGVHGEWDAGMDGYALLLAIPVIPVHGQTLRVVMTCSGITGDPGTYAACMGIMLSPTTTPTAPNGYFASGFEQKATSGYRTLTPDRLGDNWVGVTVMTGALTTVVEFPWGPSSPLTCNCVTWGADSGNNYRANQSGNGGTWTAPTIGICMQNPNTNLANGAVEVVWADVVITVEVIL